MENLTRTVSLRDAPVALRTNCETGESISPTGIFSDEDVTALEHHRRDELERSRRNR